MRVQYICFVRRNNKNEIIRAPDRKVILRIIRRYFSYFSTKPYVVTLVGNVTNGSNEGSQHMFFFSPAKQKRDICTAFPAAALSAAAA